MEYRRDSGGGNLANEIAREGTLDCAEFLGHRLRTGLAGGGHCLHFANWRAVFFVGILPALVVLWIRRGVPESEMWKRGKSTPASTSAGFVTIFKPPYAKHTLALLFTNFFGMSAWWGLFTWIPPYLSLPVEQGGRGFGVMGTTTLLVVLNLFGMFPGYASFGWVADRFGRRKTFIGYLLAASLLVPLYAIVRSPRL